MTNHALKLKSPRKIERMVYSMPGVKLESDEIEMARKMVKRFHRKLTFLSARQVKKARNPDALLGNIMIEFKHVQGNLTTAISAFTKASYQAPFVFLWIENPDIKSGELWHRVYGRIKRLNTPDPETGRVKWDERRVDWLLVELNGKFHSWNIKRMYEEILELENREQLELPMPELHFDQG